MALLERTLLATVFLVGPNFSVSADQCTEQCDATNLDGLAVSFCGTDLIHHDSHYSAFDNQCYDACFIMTYYQGTCGCPNDCGALFNHGECSNNTCVCSTDFSGVDCSLPSAKHDCSLHGKIVIPSDSKSDFPFDYCSCDDGWTGTDCSTPVLTIGNTPWGTLFDTQVYTDLDEYGDSHPVWNLSVLATVRIVMNESDYLNLLQPWNLYNETYAPATVYFDNGNLRETFTNVGFRVKGATSRLNQKKGWNIKFDAFVDGQQFLDLKKLSFKPGSVSDDTLLKTMLYTDFMRAMGVPTQRASYALLYVNTQFIGIYYMHEEISPEFIASRIEGDDGSGNTMKLFYDVVMQYFGPDNTYYRTVNNTNVLGVDMMYYDQSDGDGNWTSFIQWLEFINTSTDAEFEEKIGDYLHIKSLLKQMVIESFMLSSDNLVSGQNYYTYNRVDEHGKATLEWQVIEFDFDECFNYDRTTGQPATQDPNVFTYFVLPDTNDEHNPLLSRLLSLPEHNASYVEYYNTFLDGVFGSDSPQQPTARYSAMQQFIEPWVAKDTLWQMSFGMTADQFTLDAQWTIDNLTKRYQDVMLQVAAV